MRSKDLIGILMVMSVVGVIFYGFYIAYTLSLPKYYEDTLCPLTGVKAATIVVVDKTDPFERYQIEALKARILSLRNDLRLLEKISITVVERKADGQARIRQTLAICNPGKGENASPIYQNPAKIEARYNERFREPFDRELQLLLVPGTATTSPIVEAMVEAISNDPKVLAADTRRLIIFSDLYENTARSSAYKPNFSADMITSQIPDNARSWLSGASVHVEVIRRSNPGQQRALQQVWESAFAAAGAKARFSAF